MQWPWTATRGRTVNKALLIDGAPDVSFQDFGHCRVHKDCDYPAANESGICRKHLDAYAMGDDSIAEFSRTPLPERAQQPACVKTHKLSTHYRPVRVRNEMTCVVPDCFGVKTHRGICSGCASHLSLHPRTNRSKRIRAARLPSKRGKGYSQ